MDALLLMIFAAFADGDSWMIREALREPAAWVLGLLIMVIGGFIIMMIYRFVPFIERHLESYVMVISYLTIGGIIFFGRPSLTMTMNSS